MRWQIATEEEAAQQMAHRDTETETIRKLQSLDGRIDIL